jgi:hypothetical protein
MRAKRVVVAAVLVLGFASAAGCTPQRARTKISGGNGAPAAHRRLPAPANADLATLMERFYQQVEGAHWPFAYAMLAPRYRAAVSQDRFVALYDRYTDLDVSLRQYGDRVVVAFLGATERDSRKAHRFEETTTLAWDGEDWKIVRIVRRDISRTGRRSGSRQ